MKKQGCLAFQYYSKLGTTVLVSFLSFFAFSSASYLWALVSFTSPSRAASVRGRARVRARFRHFMAHLRELHLAKCGLEGPCPLSIADAKELVVLNLADNEDLDGELPSSLTELHWLEVISLVHHAQPTTLSQAQSLLGIYEFQ